MTKRTHDTIRNIAIIAHVDHGKTTIIDTLLQQSGTFEAHKEMGERVMDSNDLEKERGITILAKCTALDWNDHKINIIDTPGHADFGGEVERVLNMTDGVILLVDSAEGPLPQTKFVLGKALAQGQRPIVVINKIDRGDARPDEVLDEVFDLFVSLDASDEQLDFPIMYASGRNGWCAKELDDERVNLHPLLDLVIDHVPAPNVEDDKPFSMLTTLLSADPYLGRTLTGKVYSGVAKMNMPVKSMNLESELVEQARLTKLFGFKGTDRVPVEEAIAGDIICVAGLQKTSVADTICDTVVENSIPTTPIDPPTMSITITVNDSPFAGKEGDKVTSTMIRQRLLAEAETNVAIKVSQTENRDAFEVSGRGELQLGVLIENMRREGFELSVSRPRVVMKTDDAGKKLEPIEEVVIDVDEEYSGSVIEKMSLRKAELVEMKNSAHHKTRMIFHAPARGLIGYQSEFLTDTRGTGVMNRLFHDYAPYKGDIQGRRNGALISNDTGMAVAYAIFNLQDRGAMFIGHQDPVYTGMIVGEHNRDNDLELNVMKGKKLTNMRASGSDEAVILTPPRKLSLEEMMSYINDDELVEVTPKSLRLRKRYLDPNDRKRMSRAAKD